MASLACMLKDLGNDVIGSDIDKHFFTEEELVKNGIKILPFSKDNIKDNSTVIIGNAFLEDHEEVKAARANKTCKCYRYHEYLGEFIKNYKSIGIAGSHGKTTTTTLAKTILSSFKKTGYLIGDGEGYISKDSEYICIEADEFRRHFCSYFVNYAVITNIEIDHIDYFKDENDYFNAYQEFVDNVKECVVFNGDDNWCKKLDFKNKIHYSYGFEKDNDFVISNLSINEDKSSFDLVFKGTTLYHFNLPIVQKHIISDAVAVIALAIALCFDIKRIESSLSSYIGPKRRFVIEHFKNSIFVDDYAHHPTEVKVTIEAAKEMFKDKKIIAIFKPHRASRVKYFVDDFVDALKIADKVYLLDFTSIDDKQDGTDIDITYLANKLDGSIVLPENEEGAKQLADNKDAVYLFMSSKDIYNIANMCKKYL